jgi:uncharacterized repeat protein (TIGR01451 family)
MIQFRSVATLAGARLKRLLLCGAGLLGAALVQPAVAGVNTLSRVGLYGGAVYNVAFHPTNPATIYAVMESSVYRSTDAGVTWQFATDEFFERPRDLAVNASHPDRLFVVASRDLVSSENAGAAFTRLDISEQLDNGLDVEYSADGNVLYASTGLRVYRSLDHGRSWSTGGAIPLVGSAATNLVVDPRDANRLYAAGFLEAAYRSTDGGATWQVVWNQPNTEINDLAIANTEPRRIWAAANNGTWSSDDGGTTWLRWQTDGARFVVVDPNDPTVVYVGTFNGVRRTRDNGVTWETLPDAAVGMIESIAVAPGDSNRLIVGGHRGFARSTDGGAHWSSHAEGMDALYISQLLSSPASGRIYVNTHSRPAFAISLDDGSTVEFDSGVEGSPMLVIPGAPDRLYMGSGNDILRSLDGGATWSTHGVPTGSSIFGLASGSADGSRVLAVTGFALYSSPDGGTTWGPGPSLAGTPRVLASAPSNPQVVYIGASLPDSRTAVLRSADGGSTWATREFPSAQIGPIAVDPRNEQTVYVGGQGTLMKSTDGGQTWQALAMPGIGWWTVSLAIDPWNPDIVYSGSIGHIARSVDAGATWQLLASVEDRRWIINQLALDPQHPHSLYVGTEGHGVKEISIQPDLRIAATHDDVPVGYGQAGSYSYRITNAGPFDATNVRARIQLPAGATNILADSRAASCTAAGTIATCVVPILRNNANVDITITATHATSGDYSVVATLEGDQPDAASADNSVTTNIAVGEVTDLSVILTGSAIIARGEAANLTLRVTNAGPNTASVASVTLQLGTGMTVASVTPSTNGGVSTCAIAGNAASCQLPQLAVGASVTLNVVSTANAASGSFTHMASVDASGTDVNGGNNVASAVTTVSDVSQGIGGGNPGGGGGSTSPFLLMALLLLSGMRAAANKFQPSARRPLS